VVVIYGSCRRSVTVRTVEIPPSVLAAEARARDLGFELSSEPEVGRLLAFFAQAVPPGGRILEIGTGVGAGLSWIVQGLGDRCDVSVVSIELDGGLVSMLRDLNWPEWVSIVEGDGADLTGTLGTFDLIFPDAPGGKIFKLSKTVDSLRPGGVLMVDDMDLSRHSDPELREVLAKVRQRLTDHPDLISSELPFASGVIVACRLRA
jgi:demethylmenaquinone methyltransferase/2-methoxy-6-polyprenyl-1,4-benzoquinol methylase